VDEDDDEIYKRDLAPWDPDEVPEEAHWAAEALDEDFGHFTPDTDDPAELDAEFDDAFWMYDLDDILESTHLP
jgi:hypothetical protein